MRAEISIPVALGTAAVVWGVYQLALPSMADCRAEDPNDKNIASAERSALVVSTIVSGGIALLAADVTPFVVGGITACLLSWSYRHHNMTDPTTQAIFNRDAYRGRTYAVQAN